eukprot:c4749_g1_i1.p1 GENE.c4749_g1_i1~~c4749_g1_i1.p1  ORF type:complete len:111 (+),score=46.64 c4749_g1_i1:44-376(+)
MSANELAMTYAALILHDSGVEINAENLKKVAQAANVQVKAYWPRLYERILAKNDIEKLVANVGTASAAVAAPAAPTAAASGAAPAAAKAAPVKEEVKEEEEEAPQFDLFE